MGRMYSATISEVAVSVIQDIFEIAAPADSVVAIHSIYLGVSTEEGDAQDETLPLELTKGYTTTGSGGSTPTPTPLETGNAAAGSTVKANNTTQATTGTPVVLLSDSFNVRSGWQYRPTPEERIILSPSERLVLELPVAPADVMNLNGTIIFEEIGG